MDPYENVGKVWTSGAFLSSVIWFVWQPYAAYVFNWFNSPYFVIMFCNMAYVVLMLIYVKTVILLIEMPSVIFEVLSLIKYTRIFLSLRIQSSHRSFYGFPDPSRRPHRDMHQ